MARTVSIEQKLSLPLLLIGTVLFVVSLVEPHWFTGADLTHASIYAGLWKVCKSKSGSAADVCSSYNGTPGWITGPEVLLCISLSCAISALGLSVRMLFRQTTFTSILAALSAACSGVLGVTGAVVFYNRQKDTDVNEGAWCFYLSIISDAFLILSGIFLCGHTTHMARLNYSRIN